MTPKPEVELMEKVAKALFLAEHPDATWSAGRARSIWFFRAETAIQAVSTEPASVPGEDHPPNDNTVPSPPKAYWMRGGEPWTPTALWTAAHNAITEYASHSEHLYTEVEAVLSRHAVPLADRISRALLAAVPVVEGSSSAREPSPNASGQGG